VAGMPSGPGQMLRFVVRVHINGMDGLLLLGKSPVSLYLIPP
jgi:hypothetical protein